MKVLLLSCSTGGGHDAAAKALIEEFNERNIEAIRIDSIELTSKKFSRKVDNLYIDMVKKRPNLFKKVYHLGELYGKLKIKSPVYGINKFFSGNLVDYITSNNFDLVICTHLYPAETLTSIRKKNDKIKFINVATDYVCIPFWKETNPDYFVIPSSELIEDFTSKGIPSEKILPFGIPVSPKFNIKYTKKEARRQLSLPVNGKIALIMAGSMGYGNIIDTINRILDKYKKELNIVVICGNNKKMKTEIIKKFNNSNLYVFGYTDNVNIFMDASDMILTKPGGLTSTEVAVKNIPVIFTEPIPGCETYNARFFEKRQMAFWAMDSKDILLYMDMILNDKSVCDNMSNMQNKFINKQATSDIVDFAIKNYKKDAS